MNLLTGNRDLNIVVHRLILPILCPYKHLKVLNVTAFAEFEYYS